MKALAISKNIHIVVAVTVSLLFLNGAAAGQQAVLSADSYTSVSSANNNFGANPSLQISTSNASYIKFDLSKAVPSGTKAADVSRAVVKFYVGKVATPGKFDIYPITSDWGERTISYNNAPSVGAAVATQQIGRDDQGNYITIDITELVKQWIGNGQTSMPNYGFAMAAHPVDPTTPQLIDVTLDSKENSQTSHDGMLAVVMTQPPTGLTTVSRDATLVGDGTPNSPLGVAPDSITSTQLAANAVTSDKIATGSVTGDKIAAASVTGDKIQNGAITSNKIATPLTLFSSTAAPTLTLVNFSGGPSLNAGGEINTNSYYSLAGNRILSNAGQSNLFAGVEAGGLTTGAGNSFFGHQAGKANTSGYSNSFFGSMAGFRNTTGGQNSFFGLQAGEVNTTGISNSFFGFQAGVKNNGDLNSFFGAAAGVGNTTGSLNSLFGAGAGNFNSTGVQNSFFGAFAGTANTTGSFNSFFGVAAGGKNTTSLGNSFFGSTSGRDNTTGARNSFFGDSSGLLNTTGNFNAFFGAFAGQNNTSGSLNSVFGSFAGSNLTSGGDNTFVGQSADLDAANSTGNELTLIGTRAKAATGLVNATAIGAQAKVTRSNAIVLGSIAGVNGGNDTTVGIGTTAPKTKLHVTGGKIYVEANGQGVVLKSPSGSCYELTVLDGGALSTAAIACP